MRKISLILSSLLLVVFIGAVSAQEVELPKPGITPDSFFYFLDKFGEKIELVFSFGTEAKIKTHAKHALERVAEVKALLEEKGVDAPGIDIALARLEENAKKIEEMLQKQKAKGKEVEGLAQTIVEEFHKQRKAVKQVFNEAQDEFLKQKAELHSQLLEAVQADDETLAAEIRAKLVEIERQKDVAEAKKDEAITKLEAEKKKAQEELSAREKEIEEQKDKGEKVKEELEEIKEKEKELTQEKELLEAEREKAKEKKLEEIEKEKEEKLKALQEEKEKLEEEKKELEKEFKKEKSKKSKKEKSDDREN